MFGFEFWIASCSVWDCFTVWFRVYFGVGYGGEFKSQIEHIRS